MITDDLLRKHSIVSNQVDKQELQVVLANLERLLTSGATGAVVEFGCYVGTTSLFIMRLLSQFNSSNEYHVFDSFAGLPDKTTYDISVVGEQFKTGELLATKNQFIANFKKANLKLPIIHKGWFSEVSPSAVPENIIFAFLDGDYYGSIKDSLKLIESKLSKQAVIVVDDYANEALPGAAKAVDEWLKPNPQYSLRVQASLAIIYQRSS